MVGCLVGVGDVEGWVGEIRLVVLRGLGLLWFSR